MARHLEWLGYETGVDRSAMAEVADFFSRVAKRYDKPTGHPAEYDPAYYEHQMPGGMISNFKAQLAQLNLEDRLQDVLDEIPQVREDLGWPNMQTPYSQFIATQALLNVLHGRYEVVPDEIRNLVLGYWGRTPGPINDDVRDKVSRGAESITVRPGEVVPPALERVRAEQGPFDSLEYPPIAILFIPNLLDVLGSAWPIKNENPVAGHPLVEVVKRAAASRSIRSFSLSQPR
jgi:pyruvate/oxaloacetate carboxyltransferase